jgi:hypothetical protein
MTSSTIIRTATASETEIGLSPPVVVLESETGLHSADL